MAEGTRIMTKAEYANKTVVIQDHSRRTSHNGEPKTYALALDDQASTIVSETVWDRLERIMALAPDMPRFVVAGAVASPPTIHAGEGHGHQRPTVLWTPTGEQVGIAPLSVPSSF